ncbi:MAG: amidohydrolase family protein [Acidobacteria bacterium]|nr:amidohydrolase family protein [Acidobacteriota bacterium]
MRILAASFVLPITSPPVADGAIAIDDGGRIVDVGTRDRLISNYPGTALEDLGNAAILPGFVNCHSHLEITALRGALDDVEHDFRSWLLKLNDLRSGLSDDELLKNARLGALEGAQAGVTCFGDIGRMGHIGIAALKDAGLRGIVYQETEFSPDNRTAEKDFQKLAAKYEGLIDTQTDLVRIGLSPHSPYTVSSRLFELIAEYGIINRIPLSIHVAESDNEVELLQSGTGFFTGVYEKFGVEWSSPYCSPIEYMERLGVLSARPLLAHCVKVSDTDIAKIHAYGASIAHCPKSNSKFGHGTAPFERFLDEGIPVGLGSDSVASNNLCDILEEGRFASLIGRNRAGSERFIGAEEILRAATLGGAEAMVMANEIGSLQAGKQADLAVISLGHPAQQPIADIHTALVFSSNARDVRLTLVAGTVVYRS